MIPLMVVVAFGAPGVGKTTLVRDFASDPRGGKLYYCAIEEPTDEPKIVDLLVRMYNKASVGAAMEAQMAILEARIARFQRFLATELARHGAAAATAAGAGGLVVVCDGHPLSDQLYMNAKLQRGELTREQLVHYDARRAALLVELPAPFARPCAFIELALSDESGAEHAARITKRDTLAERGVDTTVFSDLARHSHKLTSDLAKLPYAPFVATVRVDTRHSPVPHPPISPQLVRFVFCSTVERDVLRSATAVLCTNGSVNSTEIAPTRDEVADNTLQKLDRDIAVPA
jgi:deoxyadenosine/deoxycytidine kinase